MTVIFGIGWLVASIALAGMMGRVLHNASENLGHISDRTKAALNEDDLYQAYVDEARDAGYLVVDKQLVRRPLDDSDPDCAPMA
jgi:hypothetical protein